jgi:hypothetical protein
VAGLNVGVFGAVFLLTMFAIQDENLKIYVLGIICACLNVLMYASPLSDLVCSSALILFTYATKYYLS